MKSYNEKNREKHYKDYKVMVDNNMRFFGDTDIKKKIIRINVKKSKSVGRKGEVLDTLNHERLHADNPHRDDSKKFDAMVNRSDARIGKKMKKKLYNLIHK